MNQIYDRQESANRFRSALRSSGVSQAKVARIVGKTRQAITKWTHRGVPLREVNTVAALLQVDPGWLANGPVPENAGAVPNRHFLALLEGLGIEQPLTWLGMPAEKMKTLGESIAAQVKLGKMVKQFNERAIEDSDCQNLYIDCEWNGYKGALISMALVAENGLEFYEVLSCENPVPWVAEHVMPVLGKEPVHLRAFQAGLNAFLGNFEHPHIVADWPEDIARFCDVLITHAGSRVGPSKITFEVDQSLFEARSLQPHNALWDARSIRDLAEARKA